MNNLLIVAHFKVIGNKRNMDCTFCQQETVSFTPYPKMRFFLEVMDNTQCFIIKNVGWKKRKNSLLVDLEIKEISAKDEFIDFETQEISARDELKAFFLDKRWEGEPITWLNHYFPEF